MMSSEILSFKCPCCSIKTITTERRYFEHSSRHLRKKETVSCVFDNCSFKTYIHGTFASHKSRKHIPHSLNDSKPELLQRSVKRLVEGDDPVFEERTQETVSEDPEEDELRELPNLIGKTLSHFLLKLESKFNVPQRCIDELVEELFLRFFISFRSYFKRYFTVML